MSELSISIDTKMLTEKLTALTARAKAAAKPAIVAGAIPIANRWKERVHTDAFKTGTYMRSIRGPKLNEIEVTADEAKGAVSTDITEPPYPFYLEYGTSHMSARPTMTPAFEESRDAAVEEMRKVYQLIFDALAP